MVNDLSDSVEEYRKATTAKSNALVSVLRTIAGHMCNHAPAFYGAASALAYLDCLMSLASFAREPHGVTMPKIVPGDAAHVEGKGLYHALLTFSQIPVANNLSLSCAAGRVMVLTGPNMAGKSTLMRTVALNLICAQLGGFVFAEEFSFTPVTRIFTRIGARDAAHKGHSTLFVELSETSDILHRADGRSLCLMDELGRGTSTHDGYSLAHAALWHLSRAGHRGAEAAFSPLVIFSTHYHALALEIRNTPTSLMQLGYMDYVLRDAAQPQAEAAPTQLSSSESSSTSSSVKEITFLYKLVPGICVRSFGVEVAVKAGIAIPVVEEAQRKSLVLAQRTTRQQLINIVQDFVGSEEEAAHARKGKTEIPALGSLA
jgi:DNA mismatch repair protein MSH6